MQPVSSQKLTKHMHSAQICGLSNDFVIFRAEVISNYYSGDHYREPPQPLFSLIPASASPPFLSPSRPVDAVQSVFLYPKTPYPQGPSLTFCLFSMESSTSVLHWLSLSSSQCWSRLSHPRGTFSIFPYSCYHHGFFVISHRSADKSCLNCYSLTSVAQG